MSIFWFVTFTDINNQPENFENFVCKAKNNNDAHKKALKFINANYHCYNKNIDISVVNITVI